MLLQIQHETKLAYSDAVTETVFEVRMAPPSTDDQTSLGYRLKITPSAPVTSYRDGFGNRVDLFNVMTPYRELVVRTTSIVRTHRTPGIEKLGDLPWVDDSPIAVEALEYLQPSPLVGPCAEVTELVNSLPKLDRLAPIQRVVENIVAAVRARLVYEKKVTTAQTPVAEALRLGRGVCQDFSHVFLGVCRGLGLPARYVSGYVSGPGELATHAWCQVWGGDACGWVDVDPTRGVFVEDHHIHTAIGRDYSDVPPNRGVWKGLAEETITVAVKVEPIERMPSDWGDWSFQTPWPADAWTTTRRSARRNGLPNQSLGHRQQQSQQ